MPRLLFLLIAVTLMGCALAQSNHFEMGNKQPGDQLLHYENVKKSSQILSIVTKEVQFPIKGATNNNSIHYIKATDKKSNGKGGYVSLLSGGINQKQVTLYFKSQRGESIDFELQIWGK